MSQLFVTLCLRADFLWEWLTWRVTVDVFVLGAFVLGAFVLGAFVVGVVTGDAVSLDDEDEVGVPPLEETLVAPASAEPEDPPELCAELALLVTLVVAPPDEAEAEDDALWLLAVTPASSKGFRVRLVGAVRGVGVWAWCEPADAAEVLDPVVAAGGAATSAFARWPWSSIGTATMAATMTITSGQRRRSNRSRLSDVILRPPCRRLAGPSAGTGSR